MARSKFLVLLGLVVAVALAASPALAEKVRAREFTTQGSRNPMVNPALPMIMVQAGDTAWVNVHMTGSNCPGNINRGGEATGGPGAAETWCFEGGPNDISSTGPIGAGTRTYTYSTLDRHHMRDDFDSLYIHATTFKAIADKSIWFGGFNNRCFSWMVTTGGYGNFWNQVMQLDLTGPFNLTNGCSVQFKTRYAIECIYDYAYLEFFSIKSSKWERVDVFNGKSGCIVAPAFATCIPDWNNYKTPAGACAAQEWAVVVNYPGNFSTGGTRDYPGYPYVNANSYVLIPGDSVSTSPGSVPTLKFRWRFNTDALWSSEESGAGGAASQAKGWWVDDVLIRANGATIHQQNFSTVAEGGRPGPPYSFPAPDSVYNGWAIRYDLDPPLEGFFLPSPGDSGLPSACQINASWQWSIVGQGQSVPPSAPPLQGPYFFALSPTVPLNYSEPGGGPFTKPGVVWQYDVFQNMLEATCDFTDTKVRVHRASAPGWDPVNGAWCPWENIDDYVFYGGGFFWNIDLNENVTQFTTQAGLDSIQFSWSMIDSGEPGDSCWDPLLPPHIDSQYLFDNVSVGVIDGSATVFSTSGRSFNFQDTFCTRTCLYNANVANSDLYGAECRYILHDADESLTVIVTDPDGIAEGNVKLFYSKNFSADDTVAFSSVDLNLSQPDLLDPTIGGTFTGTVCDTPWTPGTQIVYYIWAKDGQNNESYFPAQANPSHDDYPRYFQMRVLPSPHAKILLVDDYGRNNDNYHPCRLDTLSMPVRNFYGRLLDGFGYGFMDSLGYDRYDVQGASSNQRINEPWGFWAADPDSPEVGSRKYDIVIWTTGPYFNNVTIQDTTQTFLKQFVFNGGKILITGDRIGQDLSQPTTSQDPEFYDDLLGAEYLGFHPGGFLNPDRFAKIPTNPVGSTLIQGDSLHIFSGCRVPRPEMDKIKLHTAGLPVWSHPSIYLRYEDATADYDSLAGIYNFVTYTADTGKVVYLPFSFDALADNYEIACDPPASTPSVNIGYGDFHGRAELMKDILGIFGSPIRTAVSPTGETPFVNALYPAQPNPFNPEATVKFSLAARGQVTLAVYDVMGRRVKTLVDEVREAGPHTVLWDGRNGSGHAVASGLYFARMEATGFTATQKMTLLK